MDHKLVNTASKQLHFAQHMGNYAVKSRRQSFSYIRKKRKKELTIHLLVRKLILKLGRINISFQDAYFVYQLIYAL